MSPSHPAPPAAEPPRAFISYSHDSEAHRVRVLGLSERLRDDGVATSLDRYAEGTADPPTPRWMLNQLDWAGFVLLICTETYYRRFRGLEPGPTGKGADWEGLLITLELYESKSRTVKFVPVVFGRADVAFIPEPLRGHPYYVVDSEGGYGKLYDFLLGQAGVEPAPLGQPKRKPRVTGEPLHFDAPAPAANRGSSRDDSKEGAPRLPPEAVYQGILQRLQEILDTEDGGDFGRVLARMLISKDGGMTAGPLRIAELIRTRSPGMILESIAKALAMKPTPKVSAKALRRFCGGVCTLAVQHSWAAQHRSAITNGPIPIPIPDEVLVGLKYNVCYVLILALRNAAFDGFDLERLLATDGQDPREISFATDVVGRDPTDKGSMDDIKRIVVSLVDRGRPIRDLSDPTKLDQLFRQACEKMRSEARYDDPYFLTYVASTNRPEEEQFLARLEALGLRQSELGLLLRKTPGLYEVTLEMIHAVNGLRRICDRLGKP